MILNTAKKEKKVLLCAINEGVECSSFGHAAKFSKAFERYQKSKMISGFHSCQRSNQHFLSFELDD